VIAPGPIGFIVPVALAQVMDQLVPAFTRATGHRFTVVHRLNPEVPDHIAGGAAWDIALTNPWHVEEIIAAGRAASGSHRPFGRSPLALALRGAADGPALSADEDIAGALLAAERIAITGTGTSGGKFRTLARALGVWQDIGHRVLPMAGGYPMKALLAGEVDMAALPLTNIAPVPGAFATAVCRYGLGVHIDLSLCLSTTASCAARDFAAWLVAPARDARLEQLGANRFQLPVPGVIPRAAEAPPDP